MAAAATMTSPRMASSTISAALLSSFLPSPLTGDYNNSGTVGQGGLPDLLPHFGEDVTVYALGDGNGDGHIDAADYTVWRDHLGQSSSGSAPLSPPQSKRSRSQIPRWSE